MSREALRSRGFAALIVFVLGFFPAVVTAEDAPAVSAAPPPTAIAWNQEQAATMAADLAQALNGLRDALRREPDSSIVPGGGSRQKHRVRDRLRLMETESKYLASQLRDGRGRDETLPVFKRINEIRRDTADDARRMFLQEPVLAKIDAAREPLEELAGFYGVKLEGQLQH